MKRRKDKGITIIVLIITIVVMFILAAVSVNLVIRGDLFNSAKGAVKKTNGKIAETETQVNELLSEWERLNVEWGDSPTPETCSHIWGAWNTTKAASCTEAGSRKATCTKCGKTKTETLRALGHNFVNGSCTRCGTECEHTYVDRACTKCGALEVVALAVGDFISYTPDTADTNYTKMTEVYTGTSENPTDGIPKDKTLTWQVMSINTDGTVDLVSTESIATIVYFIGGEGFNNGVYLLNDLCRTHYSNSTLGVTARSIDLEDIEKKLNSTGINARNEYSNGTYTYGETPPAYTKATRTPDIYTKVSQDTAGESLDYYTSPTTETYTTPDSLTAKQTDYSFSSTPADYFDDSTFHELIFGTNADYWLASRFADCDIDKKSLGFCGVRFGLRFVAGADLSGKSMFCSFGTFPKGYNYRVRPVVTLTSNIQISTGGGSLAHPRTLVKK